MVGTWAPHSHIIGLRKGDTRLQAPNINTKLISQQGVCVVVGKQWTNTRACNQSRSHPTRAKE
eukprot:12664678-Alexandrium_andersonii.AAC.1